jgi:hypothetical protein
MTQIRKTLVSELQSWWKSAYTTYDIILFNLDGLLNGLSQSRSNSSGRSVCVLRTDYYLSRIDNINASGEDLINISIS